MLSLVFANFLNSLATLATLAASVSYSETAIIIGLNICYMKNSS